MLFQYFEKAVSYWSSRFHITLGCMWTHKLKLMLLFKKVYNNITSDTLIVKFGWCGLICISFLGGSKVIQVHRTREVRLFDLRRRHKYLVFLKKNKTKKRLKPPNTLQKNGWMQIKCQYSVWFKCQGIKMSF